MLSIIFIFSLLYHADDIIKTLWNYGNKSPAYALSILISENIMYICHMAMNIHVKL